MYRQLCVEDESGRREGHAHRQDEADADTGDESLRDGGEADDRERERDVGDSGLQGGVVQHLLHVEGEQEELREDRRPQQ